MKTREHNTPKPIQYSERDCNRETHSSDTYIKQNRDNPGKVTCDITAQRQRQESHHIFKAGPFYRTSSRLPRPTQGDHVSKIH